MSKFEIVSADRNMANQLAPHLKLADRREIMASSGMEPLEALLESIAVSDEDMCWAATLNEIPVAMFGANKLTDDNLVGGIWLLTSDKIALYPLDFMRHCKEGLTFMHKRYEYLTNFIDARNMPSMRWLPRLGFRPCQKIEKYGFAGAPFIQYVSQRK
jgi:hypothetical protein